MKWPGKVTALWGEPGDDTSPWRYLLTCTWDATRPRMAAIGLNPSTASPAAGPDATCQRWLSMAERWGFGSLAIANLWSLRATKPSDCLSRTFAIAGHPPRKVGQDPRLDVCAPAAMDVLRAADLVLCCWGATARLAEFPHGAYPPLTIGSDPCSPRAAYLHATGDGYPIHPLARIKGVEVSKLRPRDWVTGELVRLPIDEERQK